MNFTYIVKKELRTYTSYITDDKDNIKYTNCMVSYHDFKVNFFFK